MMQLLGFVIACAWFAGVVILVNRKEACSDKRGHDWLPHGFADWKCGRCGRVR